jgi:hypothetical protein
MGHPARIEPLPAKSAAFVGKPANDVEKPAFTSLEWSVIRFARQDGLSTLREPGPIGRFWNWLIGRTGSPRLSNERLEALRRMAVLSWHYGFTVNGDDLSEFLSAGFSPDQYELMVTSIWSALSTPRRNAA